MARLLSLADGVPKEISASASQKGGQGPVGNFVFMSHTAPGLPSAWRCSLLRLRLWGHFKVLLWFYRRRCGDLINDNVLLLSQHQRWAVAQGLEALVDVAYRVLRVPQRG